MSNITFTIDAVPTPTISLGDAFEKDMAYYSAKGKFPPLGRSALRQAEERLNNYLKYVNESFIQEGFSSASPDVSTAVDTKVAMWSNDGVATLTQALVTTAAMTIAPEETANIDFSWCLTGTHEPEVIIETTEPSEEGEEPITTITTNYGTLTAQLWMNGTKVREWRQKLQAGDNTVGASVCYGGQIAGSHLIQLKLQLSHGTLTIATNEHYAFGQGRIAR